MAYLLVACGTENELVVKGPHIVRGARIGHVCHTEAAVSGGDVFTAHVRYLRQGHAARQIKYDHGDSLTGGKGEGLLIKDRAVGLPDRDCMEAVGDLLINRHCGKG